MIVSCGASSKFHRTSFQNQRFARCFRQFLQKKLPKGSFRAMLPTLFTEKASKRTESLKWKKIPQKNGKKFPEKFWTRFKSLLSENKPRCFGKKQVRSSFSSVRSLFPPFIVSVFRLNFSSNNSQEKKGSFSCGFFGWCIYMFLNHQNRSNAFTEFWFLQSSTYRSCQLTHIVHLHVTWDFLQICSFTMAELRWKGCGV